MRTFLQLTYQTVKQCLRQGIVLVLQFTALFIIWIHPVISLFVFRQQEKLVTDGALAITWISGCITACVMGNIAITQEIRSGTFSLLLSKPINPSLYILAKTIGVLVSLFVTVWINSIGTLLAIRIAKDQFHIERNLFILFFLAIIISTLIGAGNNFFRHRSFSLNCMVALGISFPILGIIGCRFSQNPQGWELYSLEVVKAIILILCSVMVMGVLSACLCFYIHRTGNAIICGFLFCTGLISDYVYHLAQKIQPLQILEVIAYLPFLLIIISLASWKITIYRARFRLRWIYHLCWLSLIGLLLLCGIYGINHSSHVISEFQTNIANIGIYLFLGLLAFFHIFLPNWQLFWLADAVSSQKIIPVAYLAFAMVYVLCFLVLSVSLTLLFFPCKEIGKRD